MERWISYGWREEEQWLPCRCSAVESDIVRQGRCRSKAGELSEQRIKEAWKGGLIDEGDRRMWEDEDGGLRMEWRSCSLELGVGSCGL